MTHQDSGIPSVGNIDAVVIGGGISGLATADALARQGQRVHLIERADRLGGAVRSEMKNGYLCEAGPNSMLVKSEAVWNYLQELGLGESLVQANAISDNRFLVKRGRICPLPRSLMGGVTTPLYSPGEKLRLLGEPFIKATNLADESVTSFVSRRMGSAFLEYGISALVSGIYAGNPDTLSIRHAFPKVWNLEQNYGSLIRGAVRLGLERKRSGITPFKSRMISFRGGLEELVPALCRHAGLTVSTGTSVQSLSREENGAWRITAQGGAASLDLTARRLVVCTPLGAYTELPFEKDVKRQLGRIPVPVHPPLSTLVLGFDRQQVAHPLDGFGVLCPRQEKRFCLGAIFSSTLFPGRAPAGKVALMCFIGGVQQPENGQLPESDLVREAVRDLRPLLGLDGQPEFASHTFWPHAIPQYDVGHADFLSALDSVEARFPRLHLRGNFRGGPGLHDCFESGLDFASDPGIHDLTA